MTRQTLRRWSPDTGRRDATLRASRAALTTARPLERGLLPERFGSGSHPELTAGPSSARRTAAPRPHRMRIGYLLDRFPCASHGFIVHELRELESRGIDVHVFPLAWPEGRLDDTASVLGRLRRPVEYALADVPPQDAADLHARQARTLAPLLTLRGIEHLHAHGTIGTADLAREVTALAGVTYSFTAHAEGLYDDGHRQSLCQKIGAGAFVVALTQMDEARLLEVGGALAAGRVHRIPMGVNLEESRFGEADDHESDSILAVGPLVEESGFADLIDAVEALGRRGRAVRLTIVGTGALDRALSARIDQRGLSARVRLIDTVCRSQLAMLMRVHSVLALPWVARDREALANVALEAMAIGLPVLSTDLPGIREMIEDGMSGRVIPAGDRQWLAGALETLLASADLRERMARRARATVERRFVASRNVPQLSRLFSRAVSSRRLGM